jgi:hypothetical protein
MNRSVLSGGATFQVSISALLAFDQREHQIQDHPRLPLHTHITHNANDTKDIALCANLGPAVPALAPAAAMPPRLVLPPHKKDAARPARPIIHFLHRHPRPHHLQPTLVGAKRLPHSPEVPPQGRPATPPAHPPPTHHPRNHNFTATSRATSIREKVPSQRSRRC